MEELILYYCVRAFGALVRALPAVAALNVGKFIGLMAYTFNWKHRILVYTNLKIAFASSKSIREIKKINRETFINFGQNFVELLRMPLLSKTSYDQLVKVEGKEHIDEALKKGKGVILLAMHFGSWELASLSCAMLGFPYKVLVKTQKKYSKLDELLNSYRACGGSVVLSRGMGTRDFVRSLMNNEVIGMVVDQGGRDGSLIPFFNRSASMSVGAIRMGLKWDVPICFSIIYREGGSQHRMIINKPMELEKSEDAEKDVTVNLRKVTRLMEDYIKQHPAEYMWFYKIWKYSKDANILVLSDGKAGHLNQSSVVAKLTQTALLERMIRATVQTITVTFRNKLLRRLFSLISFFVPPSLYQGQLEFLRWFLTRECYEQIMLTKADFVVSCGSSLAGLNSYLSREFNAKSLVVLKPGLFSFKRFDLVVLPQHDGPQTVRAKSKVVVSQAALNLITPEYLEEKTQGLLNRFSHLKNRSRLCLGLFIGGDAKNVFLSEHQIKIVINQIKEVAGQYDVDILVTTSRRTPLKIEQLIYKELKRFPLCPLLILANRENVPEAVGGILGLSQVVVVSGDSISMISEAASSGKSTVVFSPEVQEKVLKKMNKHVAFIEHLNAQGYIISCQARDLSHALQTVLKNKNRTKQINDNPAILEAVRHVI